MSLRSLLQKLFSVRVADISGVGSSAASAAPVDGLHEPRATTNSLVKPEPPRKDVHGTE